MKYENDSLVMEEVTCWNCSGTGKSKQGTWCQYKDKTVISHPGRKCKCCGAKNKWNHDIVSWTEVTCHICEGKGTRMETLQDNVPSEVHDQLPFIVKSRVSQQCTAFENLYGSLDIIGGATDYGRRFEWVKDNNPSDEEIIQMVKKDYSPRSAYCFVDRKSEKLAKEFGIFIGPNGFTVRSIF